MIRLLVVEDEPQTRRALSISLRARGYEIETAVSGEEALGQALASTPDGVILDIGAPGVQAAELVRLLRAWTVGPIVLLSARDQERDRLAALDAGADDYVTKPFDMGELLCRLRAGLAGTTNAETACPTWVETPDFALDLAASRAYVGGEEVPLTPAEWQLVEVLVRHRGGLVPERELLDRLRGSLSGEDPNCLRRAMAEIRGKLEPDPARPRYLLAEPGLGYRFLTA